MYKSTSLPASPPLLPLEIREQLNGRQWTILSDESSWHQVFYREVTCQINSEPFSVLYSTDKGRPNSPIVHLVSMMILKEGKNWTEAELFSNCLFNLQVRAALGLEFGQTIPTESTYYKFKAQLSDYKETNGRDLLEECYQNLTATQCKRHNCKGTKARMDSKLFNANIATVTRLQLVLGIICLFYNSLSASLKSKLNETQQNWLATISGKSVFQYSYELDKVTKKQHLLDLGNLLKSLVDLYSPADSVVYNLLVRLWSEQYEYKEDNDSIQLKPKEDIKGTTLQSPHDTQAEYRKKKVVKKSNK